MNLPAAEEKQIQELLTLFAVMRCSWLSSVRPDGRPHGVPIWHVMRQGKIYFATAARSVKAVNLASNPYVSLAAYLDDPESGVVIDGVARLSPELRADISVLFEQKYDWAIRDDATSDALFEIEPHKLIAWGNPGKGRWSADQIRAASRSQA